MANVKIVHNFPDQMKLSCFANIHVKEKIQLLHTMDNVCNVNSMKEKLINKHVDQLDQPLAELMNI